VRSLLARTLHGAVDSSVVVRVALPVVDGSVVCGGVVAVVRWIVRTRAGIVAGLGGTWSPEQEARSEARVETLVADSRLAGLLRVSMAAAAAADRGSRLRRLMDRVLALELVTRARLAGLVAVAAVITQTIVVSIVGVPVQRVGWSVRACMAVAGLVLVWRPRVFALAWQSRFDLERTHGS
jgi:hypothetical protein